VQTRSKLIPLVQLLKNTNIVTTILVGFFGVVISASVASVQFRADSREFAKETQRFWRDFRSVVKSTAEHTGKLGGSYIAFAQATGELLDAYNYINVRGNREALQTDAKYLAAYARFFQELSNLTNLIETATIDYDFLRLEYASVASELEISGWREFFMQANDVKSWKEKISGRVFGLHSRVSKLIERFERVDAVRPELEKFTFEMGRDINDIAVPHLNGLQRMMEMNLQKYQKKLG